MNRSPARRAHDAIRRRRAARDFRARVAPVMAAAITGAAVVTAAASVIGALAMGAVVNASASPGWRLVATTRDGAAYVLDSGLTRDDCAAERADVTSFYLPADVRRVTVGAALDCER